MITSAEEFVTLRQSDNMADQHRASHDTADYAVWVDVINRYAEFKTWVIHNKTIPIEILETLTSDKDPKVRAAVARKRKVNDAIFNVLSVDRDEDVRYALMCNTKLSLDKIKAIKVYD
jgi:hypothetical protein